jgi:hypothetical protein
MDIQTFRCIVSDNTQEIKPHSIVSDFLAEQGLDCKPMRAVLTYEAQLNIAKARQELFVNIFPDETWKDNFMIQPCYDKYAGCILLVPFIFTIGLEAFDHPTFWPNLVHEQWHANSQDFGKEFDVSGPDHVNIVGFNSQIILDGQDIKTGQAFEEVCAVYLEHLFELRLIELGHFVFAYGPTQINDFGSNGISARTEVRSIAELDFNYSVEPDWLLEVDKFCDEHLSYKISVNYAIAKTFSMTLFTKVDGLWELVKESRTNFELCDKVIATLSGMEYVLATRKGVTKTIDFIKKNYNPDHYAVSGDILDAFKFRYYIDNQEANITLQLLNGGYELISIWDMIPAVWECFQIDYWFAFNVQRMRFLLSD